MNSTKLDTKFKFVKCDGVADKLKRLQKGSIDIAIGGITITEDPEMIFDFTHQSGSAIQAAVKDKVYRSVGVISFGILDCGMPNRLHWKL